MADKNPPKDDHIELDGHRICFDDNKDGGISIDSLGDFTIEVDNDSILQVSQDAGFTITGGDASYMAENGECHIVGDEEIRLKCCDNEIIIKDGEITISGQRVSMHHWGGEGGAADETLAEEHQVELRTIKTLPVWRKQLPDMADNDFGQILRLPDNLRQRFLLYLIIMHQAPGEMTVDTWLKQSEYAFASCLVDSETLKSEFNLWLDNEIGQADAKALSSSLDNLTGLIKSEALTNTIQEALQLDKPQSLRHGYIYVMAKCADGPNDCAFKQNRLFKEYEVAAYEHGNTFHEIDLSQYAGLDVRPSGEGGNCIELPCVYVKDDEPFAYFTDVQVMFSATQLSWARLQRYGGIDLADKRLQQITEPEQLQNIQKVGSQQVDSNLRNKRFGAPIPDDLLKAEYQAQYELAEPITTPVAGSDKAEVWAKTSLYRYENMDPSHSLLLLDDPLGMTLVAQQQFMELRQQLLALVNQLEHDDSMRTALVAYQFFYNLRADGLGQVIDDGFLDKPVTAFKRKKAFYQALSKGQALLDIEKFKKVLRQHERDTVKVLMRRTQKLIIDSLKQPSTNTWSVSIDEAITDYFAHKGAQYGKAHAAYYGFWQAACIDVDTIDEALNTSPMPDAKLIAQHPHHDAPLGARSVEDYRAMAQANAVRDMTTIDGYTEIVYERVGFNIFEKTKTYKGNQLTSSTVKTKLYQQLEKPAGIAYLDDLLEGKLNLSELILPKIDEQPAFDDAAEDKLYLLGQGGYNAAALAKAQTELQLNIEKTINEDTKAKSEAVTDTVKTIADKTLEQANLWLDGLSAQLQKYIKELPELKQAQYKQIICAMICDINAHERSAIKLGGDGVLLALNVHTEAQYHYQVKVEKQHEHTKGNTDSTYTVTYIDNNNERQLLYFDNYDDAYHAIQHEQEFSYKQFKKDIEQSTKLKKNGITIQKGILGAKLPMSAALTWLAWGDVQDAYDEMEKHPDFYTVTYFGLQLSALLDTMQTACKHLSENGLMRHAYQVFKHNRMMELLGEEKFFLRTTSAFELLGLIGCIFDTVTSTVDFVKSCSQNDRMVMMSNLLGMISNDAILALTLKQTADKVVEKTAETAMTEEGLEGGQAVGSETAQLAEKASGKLAAKSRVGSVVSDTLIDACEFIADCLPGIDVLMLIVTLFQIGSVIFALLKDNAYEAWAKKSDFSKDGYDDKFEDVLSEYKELISLMIKPMPFITKSPRQTDAYEIILNNIDVPNSDAILKAYFSVDQPIEKHDIKYAPSTSGALPSDVINDLRAIEQIDVQAKTMYQAESLQATGMIIHVESNKLPLAKFIATYSKHAYNNLPDLDRYKIITTRESDWISSYANKNIDSWHFKLYAAGQIKIHYSKTEFIISNNPEQQEGLEKDIVKKALKNQHYSVYSAELPLDVSLKSQISHQLIDIIQREKYESDDVFNLISD